MYNVDDTCAFDVKQWHTFNLPETTVILVMPYACLFLLLVAWLSS